MENRDNSFAIFLSIKNLNFNLSNPRLLSVTNNCCRIKKMFFLAKGKILE